MAQQKNFMESMGGQGGIPLSALLQQSAHQDPRLRSQQEASGWASPVGQAAFLGGQFLEGVRQGRVQKFLMSEKQRESEWNALAQGIDRRLQDPDLTPAGRQALTKAAQDVASQRFMEETKDVAKDKKSVPGMIAGVLQNIAVGMSGGQMPQGSKKIEPGAILLDLERKIGENPEYSMKSVLAQADSAWLGAAQQAAQEVGGDPSRITQRTMMRLANPVIERLSRTLGPDAAKDWASRKLTGYAPSEEAIAKDNEARMENDLFSLMRENSQAPSAYETKLSEQEEATFQQWKTRYAPSDSGQDYDLRGAFKAGVTPDPQTGHWPDTFKKPNHPTFSVESQYAKDAPNNAGRWEGDRFVGPGSAPPAVRSTAVGGVTPAQAKAAYEHQFKVKHGAATPLQTRPVNFYIPNEPTSPGFAAQEIFTQDGRRAWIRTDTREEINPANFTTDKPEVEQNNPITLNDGKREVTGSYNPKRGIVTFSPKPGEKVTVPIEDTQLWGFSAGQRERDPYAGQMAIANRQSIAAGGQAVNNWVRTQQSLRASYTSQAQTINLKTDLSPQQKAEAIGALKSQYEQNVAEAYEASVEQYNAATAGLPEAEVKKRAPKPPPGYAERKTRIDQAQSIGSIRANRK